MLLLLFFILSQSHSFGFYQTLGGIVILINITVLSMFGANANQFDMDQSLDTEKEMKQFMNKPLLKNNMKENY